MWKRFQVPRHVSKYLFACLLTQSLVISADCIAIAEDNVTKPASNPAAEERLKSDIKYLASDELQGRAAETPGLKMGAEFIAQRFNTLGLKTDLIDGQPFQEFGLDGQTKIGATEANFLKIAKPNGEVVELELNKAFQPLRLGSNGSFDAPVVFAGYGITADQDDLKYDDFANIDVKGKVVVVIRKEPQVNDPKSPFDGTNPSQYALFTTKEMNVAKHGAAALIIINDPGTETSTPGSLIGINGGGTAFSKDQIPTLFVSRQVATSWFDDAGLSLTDLEKKIDEELKPQSVELKGFKATGSTEIVQEKLPSMNVLGLLPGKGTLAEEYVVIGAHFDHVGMGGAGSLAPGTMEVHNGADDNASGTVALLEAARALSEEAKTSTSESRRSILFIAFSGEERGLLGSAYYVKHPRFDLDKTVAMLNLDMVGRLTDNQLTIYGTGTATEFDSMITDANAKLAFEINRSPEGMGPSDHQSFFQKDIPVLHFFTGLHNDYHRPSDDYDKINYEGISRVTNMVTILANRIVNDPVRLSFVKVKGTANPQATFRNAQRRVRFGARFDNKQSDVVVQTVSPEGMAQKAGIREGDVIVSIDDAAVTSRAELDRVLQKYKTGDKITITVKRGEEKIELKADVSN